MQQPVVHKLLRSGHPQWFDHLPSCTGLVLHKHLKHSLGTGIVFDAGMKNLVEFGIYSRVGEADIKTKETVPYRKKLWEIS